MYAKNVVEPLAVKLQILRAVDRGRVMILRIDDVIAASKMKAPPGGPGGRWDGWDGRHAPDGLREIAPIYFLPLRRFRRRASVFAAPPRLVVDEARDGHVLHGDAVRLEEGLWQLGLIFRTQVRQLEARSPKRACRPLCGNEVARFPLGLLESSTTMVPNSAMASGVTSALPGDSSRRC